MRARRIAHNDAILQSPEQYRVQQVVVHTNGKKCMRFTTFAHVSRGAHCRASPKNNAGINTSVDFKQVALDTTTPALLSAAHKVTGMCAHTQGLLEQFVKSSAVSVSSQLLNAPKPSKNIEMEGTNTQNMSLMQHISVQGDGNSDEDTRDTAACEEGGNLPAAGAMQVNDAQKLDACWTEELGSSHQHIIKHGNFEWHCYLSNVCISQPAVQDMTSASASHPSSHYTQLRIIQVCAQQHTRCADYQIHSLLEPPVVGAHAPVKYTPINTNALQYFRVHSSLFASGHNNPLSKACAMRFCAGAGFKLPANLLALPVECTRKQQDSAVWYDNCDLMRNLHLNSIKHKASFCFLPIFNTYMIQTQFKLDGQQHILVSTYMPFTVRKAALPCAAPTGIPTIKQTPKRRNCSRQSSNTKSLGLVTRASGIGAR